VWEVRAGDRVPYPDQQSTAPSARRLTPSLRLEMTLTKYSGLQDACAADPVVLQRL